MGGKEAKRKRALLRDKTNGLDKEAAAAKAAEEFAEARKKQKQIEETAKNGKSEKQIKQDKSDRDERKRLREKRKREAKLATSPAVTKEQPSKRKKAAEAEPANGSSKKHKGDPRLTMFVGQLPFTTVAEDLEKHFLEAGIQSVVVRMLTEKGTNKPRGMAFVQLSSEDDVHIGLGLHQSEFQGRWINVERSSRKGKFEQDTSDIVDAAADKVDPNLSVFVGQLPYSATVESIREHFESSGVQGVTKIKMLSEKVTNKKGMAFVQLCNEDGVLEALKLHESQLGTRRIVVERSSKKEAKHKAAQAVEEDADAEEQ